VRSFIIPAIALSAASIASPAAAQIVSRTPSSDAFRPNPSIAQRGPSSPGIWRDMSDIRDRIDTARSTGEISRAEARQYRREVWAIDGLAARFGRDGMSDAEQRELTTRTLYLRSLVNRPRQSGE